MGLLNSALQIGRSALLSYQGALQVVGNNISSAGSPDYTRLLPQLDPLQGSLLGGDLHPGAGVTLNGIQRNIDEALEARLRLAIGAEEASAVERFGSARVESLYNDSSGADLATRLNTFLNGFDDVQNHPEDTAIRDLAIQNGVLLADSLRATRAGLAAAAADFDGQIADLAAEADQTARDIAELNSEITTAEAGGRGEATGLRDQRDGLLRRLSQLLDVTVREQPDGAINVYVGSEALVQGATVRGLVAVSVSDGQTTRTSVRLAETNQEIQVRGGRLAGLIAARDEHALGRIAAIDELAAAIIVEVNRLHADGQGLVGLAEVVGGRDVRDGDVPLNDAAAGLLPPPESGSFLITVADDATGTPVAYRIDVDLEDAGGTTLESLVASINDQVVGVQASITSDNRLALTAEEGFTFTFGHDGQEARPDTSGVLAALGVNTFFTGRDARDIAVNSAVVGDARLLAAAAAFHPGDGLAAGRIAELGSTPSELLNGVSLTEFYNAMVGEVAIAGAAVADELEAASAIHASLLGQRESVSGVNLDEEAIALLKFERAFQGASRFVRVVDDLLDELVLLVR